MSAAPRIVLEIEERRELERIVAASSSQVRMVERARIVLGAADGHSVARICGELGCSRPTVAKWRDASRATGSPGSQTSRVRGGR
jgi:transposase-like protein